MALILRWAQLELRRRGRSLLVLTLLVAVSAGTVLTAVAGASRAASALDRLLGQTLPATAVVVPFAPGTDWDAVRGLPGVEAVSEFPLSSYDIEGVPREAFAAGPPQGQPAFDRVERAAVLEGRLPDQGRADEVVVSPGFVDAYGLGVGDAVVLRLSSPEQIERLYEDSASAAGTPSFAAGPRIEARIVGVVRSFYFRDQPGTPGALFPSPALFERYRANLIGGIVLSGALVRLADGADGLATFRDDLAALVGSPDTEIFDQAAEATSLQRTVRFEAGSLLVAGLVVLAVAIVLVGQAVARHTAASEADLRVLRAVGMSRWHAAWAAAAGPVLAGVAGAVTGVVGAAGASTWFPIGTAAGFEPSPGPAVDGAVLGVGGILVVTLVAAGALVSAAPAVRGTGGGPAASRSAVCAALARAGLPVPVVMGARYALAAGRGAPQVRPTLLGAVTGVAGVLAALTVSAGVSDAATDPARFGQTGRFQIVVGAFGADFGLDLDPILAATAADPDVVGALETRNTALEVGDLQATTYTYEPVGSPPFPAVVTEGRMADAADEIVLGPTLASRLGVGVGDTVPVTGTRASAPMTVSGLGFVPIASTNQYDEGAWLSAAGYDRVAEGYSLHAGYLALRPGADAAAVLPRLVAAGAAAVGVPSIPLLAPDELPEITQIRNVEVLPLVLGGFLALLAAGSVGHALSTAVRHHRHEIAVLRALGMTGRQARGVVVTQASVLAAVGLLFGIPLGVALGRVLWRIVADITPLQYQPPVAVLALLLVVPLAVLVVNALALRPGRRAARLQVADVLRAEQRWA